MKFLTLPCFKKKDDLLGFTLIEIVVVIGILSVMLGVGITTVVSFKERREVLSDARNLASLLKQTQVKAGAVEIPSDCDAVGVGQFEISYAESEVSLLVRDPGGGVCKPSVVVLSFSNGTEFTVAGQVIFKTPIGSANAGTIGVCNYGVQYDLYINENGGVSEPRRSSTPGC